MLNDDAILQYFAKYIENEIGMVFSQDNYFQLKNRLDSLCTSYRLENLNRLHEVAKRGLSLELKTALLEMATNNETSFFRDKKVFDLLDKFVIPEVAKEKTPINVWSVASSSGQEAYSVAMTFEEWSAENNLPILYDIDATDINTSVLAKGRRGQYSQFEVQRGLSDSMLSKYFEKVEEKAEPWKVKQHIRRNIRFEPINLVDDFSMPRLYHIIFCRNVLIYQSQQKKVEILKKINKFLQAGGFLIMGSGESLPDMGHNYETILKMGAVVFQKNKFALNQAA